MAIETIAGIPAEPGTRTFGFLRVAPMLYGADLKVGVHVIAGQSPGPSVAVFAAQHGDELVPHLGLRRFITELDARQLRGTVVVVPIANPIAFATGHRDSWIDGLQADSGNLNRLWPGDPDGWICGRLAATLTREIVDRVDCIIDIHAAGRNSIYYGYMLDGDDEFSRRQRAMALAFGLEIMVTKAVPYMGTLTGFCHARGQLAVGVELGEFYGLGPDRDRWPETELRRNPTEVCWTGLTNVLKHMEMLPGDVWRPHRQVAVSPETPIRVSKGGLLCPCVTRRDIGTIRLRDSVLAYLYDPYSFEEIEVVRASSFDQQLLIAVNDVTPCIVHPGDKVYWVADWSTAHWYENRP